MHRTALLLSLTFSIALAGCGKTTTERLQLPPLDAVPKVNLERYLGTWYEIASYPQRFQEGCTGTTATYTLRSDGEIDVLNKCRKGRLRAIKTKLTTHPFELGKPLRYSLRGARRLRIGDYRVIYRIEPPRPGLGSEDWSPTRGLRRVGHPIRATANPFSDWSQWAKNVEDV
jgi:lipocalin